MIQSVTQIKSLLISLIILCNMLSLHGQEYKMAWDAISKNDFKTARMHLGEAEKDPATAIDAALTTMLLETFEGNDDKERGQFDKIRKKVDDCNPYYFCNWRNTGFAGEYGLKTPEQAKFLEQLIDDPKINEMLKASARYHLSHHYIAKGDFKKAKAITLELSNVPNWQYTGPFDNISESGFDKNYPPINLARPEDRFLSSNNAEIRWITPGYNDMDGWAMIGHCIKWDAGIVYAQSFVTAPFDQELTLAAGFTGSSAKIWVNNQLIFSEQETRKTDFDVFKVPCQLQKGNNRILVQIGLEKDEFANFSIRLLGKDGKLAPNLLSSTQYADYPKIEGPLPNTVPFFASEYFLKKIAAEPENLLNYYFLSAVYLRNLQNQPALEIIEKALVDAPNNLLLRFQRLQCLLKLGNRTALSQEVEDIKRLDPECLIALAFQYQEAIGNEHYDEAQALMERWEALFGENEGTLSKRIQLLLTRKKYQEAILLIDKSYKAYPINAYFATLQHNIEVNVNKKPEAGIALYNNFLRKNYSIPLAIDLANEYIKSGMGNKAVVIFEKLDELFPGDPSNAENLLNYYYNINNIEKSRFWIEKTLSIAPFHARYWENSAKLAERAQNKQEALQSFQKALLYNPNDYDVRRQIRELEGKPDFSTLLPQYNPFDLYKKSQSANKEGEFDWYYVLDEHCTLLYPERNSEIISTLIVKVLNEGGIDRWKESSIGFDENTQTLIIEKAEILKPNGSKVTAEQNGSQLVFPNLQVGDGIYVRYKLSNYAFGRMGREFTTPYFLNAFVPTDIARYCLLTPPSIPINYINFNHNIEPKITDLGSENLRQYLWESINEPAIKDQRLMPNAYDVSKVVHISTIQDWNEIASWYGDISDAQAKRDYDVQQLGKELFPAGNTMTQTEKVRNIYTWITKNIRYSSLPFRQSGLVPQRASKVIQTKLGDCKDLASLFAALAREAGLEANLVLLNTRDQGTHAMELPSMNFNHCIVKVIADRQAWYLELTQSDLPFGSLPSADIKAFALEIPFNKKSNSPAKPFLLDPPNRLHDLREESSQIEIKGRDLLIETACIRGGAILIDTRSAYKELPPAKRIETMQATLAKKFSNPLTIKNLSFGNLNKPQDTVQFTVRYLVKNEIIEIGDLNTFKIPFHDIFFNSDAFPEETRIHPLNYWEYEDTDHYLENITIQIPNGKSVTELPKDVDLNFEGIHYTLKYTKHSTGTLQIVREIETNRDSIPADKFEAFRSFTEGVISAETRWIAFK